VGRRGDTARQAAQRRGGQGFETLESRCLLTATDAVPSIQGTVFLDANGNNMPETGEAIVGATVRLFLDDGDGIFEPGGDDVQVGPDEMTDADGRYCFDGIDGTAAYFVQQPAQVVDGANLTEQASGLIEPGTPNLIIDAFLTNQEVQAVSPAPSSDGSTLAVDPSEVIGGERDLFVELIAGVGEVQLVVNPFSLLPLLQFNSSSGVQGSASVTWDGSDLDATPTPSMGLGGVDLTQGGLNTGFAMLAGIDTAGAGDVLTFAIYQDNAENVSSASTPIPVTDGTASQYLFVPFSAFSGPVSPTNVDAIQMTLGMENVPSADGQISLVGVVGPKIFDFANEATADLSISKSNATTTVVPGETVSYQIVVQNLGPQNVMGALVQDVFPSELTNVNYSSSTTGTVSGNTPGGTGNINDTVDMAVGSSITYTVTANIDPTARETLANSATVQTPEGVTDPDPTNNTDSESDVLEPQVDLQIVKTNGLELVRPGEAVSYTITVTNAGPSSVAGATVSDVFPADLLNVSYTSSASGGAVSGNTPNGTGNINDTLDMAAGSSVIYTVSGTLADNAEDTLSNTATVTTPEGTVELDPDNNTSTHNDPIVREVDLAISKTDNVSTAVPGLSVTYQIVVQNLGPSAAVGAMVQDNFPDTLVNVSYTSTASGGATGNSSGNGDLDDLVDMPAGSSITYTVTGTVVASATGQLSNTAVVIAPPDLTETDPDNNLATDVDTLVPTVNLAVTKTNAVTVVRPDDPLSYQIVVSNAGPSDAVAATLSDVFPDELTGVSYTSLAQGGATGNTPSGTGDLNQTLNLPVGASVTYSVSATVLEAAANDISNTVSVTPANGTVESDPSNNSATHVDTLLPGVDLQITKANSVDAVIAGGPASYTIIVTNNGPNSVLDAQVTDVFPATLTTVSYTSVASGGASGNTNGSGNINDVVDLPVGSTITYTVQASVDGQASGQLVNEANVVTPDGYTELDPSNNSSTHTDRIDQALAQISGFVYVDLNDNGIKEPGESPIPGVEIQLLTDGEQVETMLTDSQGAYQFDELAAGTYDVVEVQPAGFRNGKLTVGGGIGEVSGENQFTVPLEPGDDATQLNFGELPIRPSKRSLLASHFRPA
jgi:uncharacterized repeat protein (TIGR01451 family)